MMTVSMTRNSSNANWSCRSTPTLAGRTTVPRCGGSSPLRSFMNVDLPAPLGPVRPYRRPAEKVVVTSSKSTFEPYRMETPCTEIMSGALNRERRKSDGGDGEASPSREEGQASERSDRAENRDAGEGQRV